MRVLYDLNHAGRQISEIGDVFYHDNKIYLYNDNENIRCVSEREVSQEEFDKISVDLLLKGFCTFLAYNIRFNEI